MRTTTQASPAARKADAFALMAVMAMTAVSMIVLAGAMQWASNSAFETDRNNAYYQATAAAEAASEKVLSLVERDFQADGEGLVYASLGSYQNSVPSGSENSYWNNWRFSDGQGTANNTAISRTVAWSYVPLQSQYAGLNGMASTYRVVSNARRTDTSRPVVGAVEQDFQVANIPIFQFAIFYGLDMEISCGQPFNVTGRVHSNGQLYTEPDSTLTFYGHVTAVGNITLGRAPTDNRGALGGTVTYLGEHDSKVSTLTLPIGTNNTPSAIHSILEVPPSSEDPNSTMGQQRYYNKADLILTVTNTLSTNVVSHVTNVVTNVVIYATSGLSDNFSTAIPASQLNSFVSTNASFQDYREGKTVTPIDIDVGKLATWSATNTVLRATLGRDVRLLYVSDGRYLVNSNAYLRAVRVKNGATLPSQGLTVATERPMYVQGDFNAPVVAQRGTTNTTSTLPASLLGDAITVLSDSWTDANSAAAVGNRNATSTTVNAAFLAGIVPTTVYNSYSGGVENYPRFLETWGTGRVFTYNGSMVVLFPSRYAIGEWGLGNVYSPPPRNWAFDLNFMDATKLPPGTPSVRALIRGQWAHIAPSPSS